MNHKVKMNAETNINGTCLQGYFPEPTRYKDLVRVFGKPNSDTDGYKVDAEWVGTINDKPFTIYNYKTGKNYNGCSGTATSKITTWHIGGFNKSVVYELVEYFNAFLADTKKSGKYVIWVAHEFDTLIEADEAEREFQQDGFKTKLGVIS